MLGEHGAVRGLWKLAVEQVRECVTGFFLTPRIFTRLRRTNHRNLPHTHSSSSKKKKKNLNNSRGNVLEKRGVGEGLEVADFSDCRR